MRSKTNETNFNIRLRKYKIVKETNIDATLASLTLSLGEAKFSKYNKFKQSFIYFL